MEKFQNIKGTKDILPAYFSEGNATTELVRYIENKFVETCEKFGFEQIITPTFEYAELFKRGVGESTDVVQKETYSFKDNGGRELSLRPEGTAGVIRSYIQNKLYNTSNDVVKLFYKGSMFRQENPQRGRQREFNQLGVEAIGVDSAMLDAEIILLANDFLNSLELKNVELEINSIGCSECRKYYKNELLSYLNKRKDQLCSDCKNRMDKNPLRVLDCKEETCKSQLKDAPLISDYLCDLCNSEFERLQSYLNGLNISFNVNPKLVRGLDYYVKTAFEFIESSIGAQSTVCGGGRYNNLAEELGSPVSKPGIGFALGLERLMIILENQRLIPNFERKLDYFLIWNNEEAKLKQLEIANKLRKKGYTVSLEYTEKKFKNQLKSAVRNQAKYALILGEDELLEDVIAIRNLETKEQVKMNIHSFITNI